MRNKTTILMVALLLCLILLCSCDVESGSGTEVDVKKTIDIANELQKNQPTPSDIEYSLERYNLIRRAYWVNGMREKALSLPCEIEKPMGYVVLFIGTATVGAFTVDGKVSSLNSFLTPDSELYEQAFNGSGASSGNRWLADVDGSYGENDTGIFFFTTDGKYIEFSGDYLYSDIPLSIKEPVVNYEEKDR